MRVFSKSDSGEGKISTAMFLFAGFAAVAILAITWIGNTAAGSTADTASCIARLGGQAATNANVCRSNEANAAVAHEARTGGPSFIADFGSSGSDPTFTGDENITVAMAQVNFKRGIERFESEKLTVADRAAPYLTQLQNATTKAQAVQALSALQQMIRSAQIDGESGSGSTIQEGANKLRAINHPAAEQAQIAQILAADGNGYLARGLTAANSGISGSDSMTIAQLRSLSSSIRTELASAKANYSSSVVELKKTIEMVEANR